MSFFALRYGRSGRNKIKLKIESKTVDCFVSQQSWVNIGLERVMTRHETRSLESSGISLSKYLLKFESWLNFSGYSVKIFLHVFSLYWLEFSEPIRDFRFNWLNWLLTRQGSRTDSNQAFSTRSIPNSTPLDRTLSHIPRWDR